MYGSRYSSLVVKHCPLLLQACEEKGEDYDRVKLLEIGADEAERWERKKKKKNPDPGFSGICCGLFSIPGWEW